MGVRPQVGDPLRACPDCPAWEFGGAPHCARCAGLVDALIDEAKQTFDVARQDELLAQAHARIVDDAALVWVVHDTNPHALSPKVKKFVQAQHWFQDLTQIGLE